MKLLTQNIHTNETICQSDLQITLEDDINVPDTKPDIDQLIKTHGEVELTSIKPADGKVLLQGNLSFTILYITTEDIRPIHSMKGQIPFQETVNMEKLIPDQEILCHFDLEDCQSALINSRKVSVRSIISFHCCQSKNSDYAAGIDIVSEEAARADMEQVSPPEGIQRQYDDFSLTQLAIQKKDVFRIKDEFILPKGKPNIDTILYYEMTPQNIQNRIVENGIRFLGDLQLFILYIPEEEERRLEYLETEIPFDDIISCDHCTEDMIFDIEIQNTTKELVLKPDEDGEQRVLDFELNLNVLIKFYQEETFHYLKDAYSTACSLELEKNDMYYSKLLMKNQSIARLADHIHIVENADSILQICHATGSVQIDDQTIVPDGIEIEGAITLDILYITENDSRPLLLTQGTIPFKHTIEIRGISDKDDYELQSSINQISVIMLDGEEVEAKIVLNLCAFVFSHLHQNIITKITEKPLDLERIQAMPGLVGFLADKDGTLWDIAKEYGTTVESIMELNEMSTDHITAGDRILLLKQIDGF